MMWVPVDWLADRIVVRVYRPIASYPIIVSCICVLVTVGLSGPLLLMEARSDAEHLFRAKDNSPVHRFPMDFSRDFDISRAVKMIDFARLVFTAKDGGDLFRPEIWSEIQHLDEIVRHKVMIQQGDQELRYDNFCTRSEQRCYRDDLLKIFTASVRNAMQQGIGSIRFPYLIDLKQFKYHFLGQTLAQVKVDSRNNVLNASMGGLLYFLSEDHGLSKSWQRAVATAVYQLEENSTLHVSLLSNDILETEYHNTLMFVIKMETLMFICALVVWIILARPSASEAVGLLMGLISAGCSGLIGVGFTVLVIGWEFTLLQLGILLVLVGGALVEWPILLRICRNDPETGLRRAGSWLLTGAVCPAMLYALAWVILPCPATALSSLPWALGSLIYLPLQLVTLAAWRSLAGPFPSCQSATVVKKPEEGNSSTIKVLTLVGVWMALGTLSSWAVYNLGTRMAPEYFYSPRSEVFHSLKTEELHFSEFLYRIHIVVEQPLDYSNPEVQRQIAKLVDNNPFSPIPELNESWLKFYLIFLKDSRSWFLTRGYNTSSTQGFLKCLKEIFLDKIPQARRFRKDIIFGGTNNSQIVASRFLIQLQGIRDSDLAQEILHRVENYGQSFPFKLSFFHILEPLMRLMDNLPWKTIGLAGVSSAFFILISFSLTANCSLSFLMGLGLFGADLGLVASLKMWAVELNSPTALLIILFFGINVKFSSYLLYCFQESHDTGAFISILSATAALCVGSFVPLVVKYFSLISDKVAILAFCNILVQILVFATPLLIKPSLDKLRCLLPQPKKVHPTKV